MAMPDMTEHKQDGTGREIPKDTPRSCQRVPERGWGDENLLACRRHPNKSQVKTHQPECLKSWTYLVKIGPAASRGRYEV